MEAGEGIGARLVEELAIEDLDGQMKAMFASWPVRPMAAIAAAK
jgi:hypothetical protein